MPNKQNKNKHDRRSNRQSTTKGKRAHSRLKHGIGKGRKSYTGGKKSKSKRS